MKKLFVSMIATTMLVTPTLSTQAAPFVPAVKVQSDVEQVQYRPRVEKDQRWDRKTQRWDRKQQVKRWKRGERVQNWRSYNRVDYRRYKLRTPPRGYQWVRVNNDFLLLSLGTGLIASIITAR